LYLRKGRTDGFFLISTVLRLAALSRSAALLTISLLGIPAQD
jgi:hypothetical protein